MAMEAMEMGVSAAGAPSVPGLKVFLMVCTALFNVDCMLVTKAAEEEKREKKERMSWLVGLRSRDLPSTWKTL